MATFPTRPEACEPRLCWLEVIRSRSKHSRLEQASECLRSRRGRRLPCGTIEANSLHLLTSPLKASRSQKPRTFSGTRAHVTAQVNAGLTDDARMSVTSRLARLASGSDTCIGGGDHLAREAHRADDLGLPQPDRGGLERRSLTGARVKSGRPRAPGASRRGPATRSSGSQSPSAGHRDLRGSRARVPPRRSPRRRCSR